MNLQQILIILILAAAVLAAIPAIPVSGDLWGVILVVLGLIAGVTGPGTGMGAADIAQRVAVYVIAAVLPTISNSLDPIWVVGPWVNSVLDHVATGIQGMAIGLFVMAVVGRIMPGAAAPSAPSTP
jgi:hypothetical protein